MKKKKTSGKLNSLNPWKDYKGEEYGGYLKDIPEPYIYRYPNKENEPRVIRINLHTYSGVLGSEGHYYASITEGTNYIFNRTTLYWTQPWDSIHLHGREWSGRYDTYKQATSAIKQVLKDWNVINNFDYKLVEDICSESISALLRQYGRRTGD